MKKRIFSILLCVCMTLTLMPIGTQTAWAAGTTYNISTGALTINSGNRSTYENATVTGTVSSDAEQLIIDGVTVNLTIEDLSITMTGYGGNMSGITLKNNATLNLTVKGTNALTGAYGGAGIDVPQGCTLNVTAESTGTLTANGGNAYGGGAGIGAVGNTWTPDYQANVTQSVGTIQISGGIIIAIGGSVYYGGSGIMGAAGIGGSMESTSGNIFISGGTVTATGGSGSAGIGGGHSGCVESVTIDGGTVTATAGSYASAIGSGYNGYTSGTLSCGIIALTGGDVTANGNIGYGGAQDNSKNVGGTVSIVSNVAVKVNGGVISPAATGVSTHSFSITIYDGRLTHTIDSASFNIGGTSYKGSIQVSEPYVGTLSYTVALSDTLTETDELAVTVSGGAYSWENISCAKNPDGYSGIIGEKLYPVSFWFYDPLITADITETMVAVKRGGIALNSDSTSGIVQLVCDGRIAKQENGTGKMTAWMTAGANTELSVTAGSLNGGIAMDKNNQTVLASSSGTVIILHDIGETTQLSEPLDLSLGSITFAENGGKLDITYTPTSGGDATTATGQYYHNEYEIIQTNSSTATINQIIFQNTIDFVKVKLNGVNMSSQGKAIDLQKSKVLMNLSGASTIDCGGGGTTYMGIQAAEGSELTIKGSGNLEVRNPSDYGVGIGGYYDSSTQKGTAAGTIRIEGGTITADTKKGAAIGNSFNCKVSTSGSIYITGGNVNASTNGNGSAIGGGSYGAPASIYITGGTVVATSTGKYCGAAIGGGADCIAGGVVEISGGSVMATSAGQGAGIGGGDLGAPPPIHISGGTVTVTNSGVYAGAIGGGYRCAAGGSVEISGGVVIANKIGSGESGSGGSLEITGGTISTASGEKPSINFTTKDGSGKDVYYTRANASSIYGASKEVTNASISGSSYGFNDVKTDSNGILHLFLPANAESTKTTANFNGTDFEGTVTSTEPNILKKVIPLQVSNGSVSSTGATLNAKANSGNTIYYAASSAALSEGSEVVSAGGVQSIVASGGTDTITLSGFTEDTAYTYYLTAKEGEDYSDVKAVTFTTLLAAPNASDVLVDYEGELLKAASGLGYMLEYALSADAETWTEVTTTGVDLTNLLNSHTGTEDISIYIRKNVSGEVSEVASVFIPARPNCSLSTLSINYANETIIIPNSVHYQFAKSTPVSWVSATEGTNDEVSLTDKISAEGTDEANLNKLYFRNSATSNTFASRVANVLIPARPETPAVPSAASVAETGITLSAVTGAEYSKNGTSWQDSTAFTGLTVNTSQIFYQRIKATDISFASLYSSASITTAKNSIAAATVTLTDCDSFTYDGTEKTPIVTVTLNEAVLDSSQYTVNYSNSNGGVGDHTNAGTVTVTVTASPSGDYSGTVSQTEVMTYTISKAPLIVTAAAASDRQYDGTNQVDITAVTLNGIKDTDTGNVSVDTSGLTGTISGTDVGTYNEVTLPSLILTGTAASNYILNQPTEPVPTTVSIAQADTLNLTGNATMVKNQANHMVELDLTQLSGYPELPGGMPGFAVTSSEPYNGLTGATVNAIGKLTLVADNTNNSAQDTVTVRITGLGNYADSTIIVTVNYTDKMPVTISGVTTQNGTYNGTNHIGYTGAPSSSYTGTYEINYTGRNGTSYNSTTAPVNAGDYMVTFKVPDSDSTYAGSVSITFTVSKATVIATADSKSMTTGGTLPNFTVSYKGIATGDTGDSIFTTQATASCTTDGKTAGSYPIIVTTPVLKDEATKNYVVGTSVNGTLNVSNSSSGALGGSSGGSSGGATADTVMVSVSSDFGNISASASVSGTTATLSVTDAQLNNIVNGQKTVGTVKMDVSSLKVDAVVIPSEIVSVADSAYGSGGLEVVLSSGTVNLDNNALDAINSKGDVKISIERINNAKLSDEHKALLGAQASTAVVVDVNIYANGSKISNFGNGKLQVSIPYTLKPGENAESITVWFIKDDGSIEPKNGVYSNGKVEFTTDHLSQYLIVKFPFVDVAENSWCYGSVAYAYNKGLFSGTSQTTFSPKNVMTRQMIWMVLARMDGKSPVNMTEARTWAVENKISDGSNPKGIITREQMAVILYRYAAYKKYDTTQGGMAIREFADYDSISKYTLPALGWAVNAELISGTANSILDPQGNATRAQVATILMRFCEKNAK